MLFTLHADAVNSNFLMQYERFKSAVEDVTKEQKLYQEQIQNQQAQIEGQISYMQQIQAERGTVQRHKDMIIQKMSKADKQKENDEQTRQQFESVLAKTLQVRSESSAHPGQKVDL